MDPTSDNPTLSGDTNTCPRKNTFLDRIAALLTYPESSQMRNCNLLGKRNYTAILREYLFYASFVSMYFITIEFFVNNNNPKMCMTTTYFVYLKSHSSIQLEKFTFMQKPNVSNTHKIILPKLKHQNDNITNIFIVGNSQKKRKYVYSEHTLHGISWFIIRINFSYHIS